MVFSSLSPHIRLNTAPIQSNEANVRKTWYLHHYWKYHA